MGLTEPTTTKRRPFRAAAGITAATLLATMMAVVSPAGADEPEPRERHGPGVTTGDPSTPSDGETITTFTPTLPLDGGVAGAEIVLRDGAGATVATSGDIDGAWTVGDGALAPGGTYEWDAVAVSGEPQIWGGIPWYDKDVGVGDLRLGGTTLPVVDVQDTKAFSVAAGFGLPAQASGLSARFWPHHDLDELRDVTGDGSPLPPTMTPQPGSETIEAAADMRPHEEEVGACVGWVYWGNGMDDAPPTYIHCEHEYALDAIYTDLAAGAEPAAYNIEGRNVAPSFQMMITADQTGDGFELSTAGKDIIAGQFPAQTGFGYRMLGYIEVPQTGTYTFGTTSPGGSRALLYDTTDDLGRTEISAPDAWSPDDLADSCWARSDRHAFKNNKTDRVTSGFGWTRYHYEYEEGDPTWYQFPDEAWATLVERLNQACAPNNDLVRWGAPVELEAGRQYPIDLAGWVGVTGGTIGFHVDGPNSDPMAVPVEWLTPAPANTIDFELGHAPLATLDDGLIAWTINGYGDELIGIHPRDGLVTYRPDGLGGWTRVGGIPDIGHSMHVDPYDRPVTFPIDGADVTVDTMLPGATLDGFDGGHLTLDDGHATMDGTFTASATNIPNNTTESVEVTHLDFTLDDDGTIATANITGTVTLHSLGPGGSSLPTDLTEVTGSLDTDTHTMHLQMHQTRYIYPSGATLAIPIDPQHLANTPSPYDTPTHFGVQTPHIGIAGLPAGSSNAATIILDDGHGALSWGLTATAMSGQAWPTIHDLALQYLEFDLDDNNHVVNPTIGGNMRTVNLLGGSDSTVNLSDLTGHLDTHAHVLHLSFKAGFRTNTITVPIHTPNLETHPNTALATNDYGDTLVVADDPHYIGDIAIITKQDPTQPFADDNADIVWLNDLYTDAGMDIPRPSGSLPQAVQITPDGNTVAVLQHDADRHRVDVIDRATPADPWAIVGSFTTDVTQVHPYATVPFAVGSDDDFDYRYLAIVNDGTVEIYSKDGSAPWQQTASHGPVGAVPSLSFDYYAEHLAIGQPGANQVTILERTGTTQWSESTTLTTTEINRFGSAVTYKWGLLAITANGNYTGQCTPGTSCNHTPGTARIYRDTDTETVWGDYNSWYNLDLTTGTGPHAALTIGGVALGPVVAAATVDTLGLFEGTPGYAPIQLY